MKKQRLDKDERELLNLVERGPWRSVPGVEGEKRRYQKMAAATLRKDKRINIRISQRDLDSLRARAVEEGLPYQTLISSLLHKFVSGRLVKV